MKFLNYGIIAMTVLAADINLHAQTYEVKFDSVNAFGWFGGDNRQTQGPRHVGVGQSVLVDTSITLESFSFYFRGPFDFAENPEGRGHEVTLTLNVRDTSGAILRTLQTIVADTFQTGWVTWPGIALDAAAQTTLIFTTYLVGAYDANQFTASNGADANAGYAGGVRYSKNGTSDADMEDWTDWGVHSWDSAFRLQGTIRSDSSGTQGDLVRGWYADGQVWIVWQTSAPDPETYAIYSTCSPFTDVSQADLIGRLYKEEWTPGALRQKTRDSTRTYIIPDGNGGVYQLAQDEGLFVETVHTTGSKYYAVVKWGETAVVPGVNGTSVPIAFRFDTNEPVQAHLQVATTLTSGYRSRIYYMWADGRDDHWNGRPDFPVMANRHKNGMPSLFIVSDAKNLPPDTPRSVVHWLHGGQGTAFQSLPDGRPGVNIEPQNGYLVAHNDDFQRYVFGQLLFAETNSWWFGWGKNHDPFDSTYAPAAGDTIINYTQRRILWIDDWLAREMNTDPERVSIQGHSVGSAGTTALAKAFPDRFATVSIFNNGFKGPQDSMGETFLGTTNQNLPTNLRNRQGDVVHVHDLHNLSTPIAPLRDLPIMRSWHGKNDNNRVMAWDSVVVAEYRLADSAPWGMQLWWDERTHVLNTFSSHWTSGTTPATQTERDNADYQERYRVNQSFPAFYNHQAYPNNADPGDGTQGTGGNGVGDDWGTWGGYHDWDLNSLVDETDCWEVTAFLIGQSQWLVDNCPYDSLVSDLAIRKPQNFLPPPNSLLSWLVVSLTTGDTLQSGTTVVDADGLVKVDSITVYRDPERVPIVFTTATPTSVGEQDGGMPRQFALHQNYPNPFNPSTTISYSVVAAADVQLLIYNPSGQLVRTLFRGQKPAGDYTLTWDGRDDAGRLLSSGQYFYRLQVGETVQTRRMLFLK
ncbi:T9SS C-terminal target domain-containing protein [Candidatus Parcubacteria bacterium]|nr:MAG: T9SS C-terminal target domain-containing protein [Candidatus Parcubacteria bacterium]